MNYPIGIQDFEKLREGNYLYIDKTQLIYKLASGFGYYFLSRPRRFGKSLLISTMEAYFLGKKELFKGLALEQLEQNWTVYPVLHLDLNTSEYRKENDLSEELNRNLLRWESIYGKGEGEVSPSQRFAGVIERACNQTGQKVVILIDEYDKPLLNSIGNPELQDCYRSQMKAFYSVMKTQDKYIKFGFITGVTRFSKVSIFSDLNNFTDISMDDEYVEICGLTEKEIRNNLDAEVEKLGGRIVMHAKVVGIHRNAQNVIDSVTYEQDGKRFTETGDVVISSMPIKDLVAGMNDVPEEPARIAAGLPYRDYMTVGVLISHLHLENKTDKKTVGNIVPDNWVYVHDRSVKMGRFQIYNNWSPYMVKDLEHTVWMGLEYFCNEGDAMWSMSDDAFAQMGIGEMVKLKLIDSPDEVLDYHVERVKKAYPAYFDTYDHMDELRKYLDTMPNLFCVGRNGQHRYNNIDHSMCTSFEAVRDILAGTTDRSNVWSVNTEQEYHEEDKKNEIE